MNTYYYQNNKDGRICARPYDDCPDGWHQILEEDVMEANLGHPTNSPTMSNRCSHYTSWGRLEERGYCFTCKAYFPEDESVIKAEGKLPSPEELDAVAHPDYYNWLPGVECIKVAQEFNFNLGNALKYIWRSGGPVTKHDEVLEDLKKARMYIEFEIERRSKG